MRIQLIAIGSTGDVQPMIVLGRELARRGHQVSLTAFDAHRAHIEAAGLGFHCLPGDAEHYIKTLIQPGAKPFTYLNRLERALGGSVDSLLDTVYNACQHVDAIVSTFFGTAMYAIANSLGIPLFETDYCLTDCTGAYCLPVMRQPPLGPAFNRATYRLAYRMIAALEARYVRPWCERMGIAPRSIAHGMDYRLRGGVAPVLYAFSEHVVPRPPEWADNIHIVGFWDESDAAWTPSPALERFLADGDTPVYIGFGSMNAGDMGYVQDALLYALERTGQRALLSAGWGRVGTGVMPESVYVLDEYAPHPWVFAQAKAVVHHGGAGTTAASLTAGRPTLIVPFGGDQFFWGNRVRDLGCGPKPLPRTALTRKRFAAALDDLVRNASYQENVSRLREKLSAENGAAMAADLIEANLSQRR